MRRSRNLPSPMHAFKLSLVAALSAFGLIGFSTVSFAANAGTDDASQAAYSGSQWLNGSDGEATGDAFLAWNLVPTSGTGFAGFFLGDSTNLNSPGANINVSGASWGMYANGDPNATATAQRMFTADGSTVSGLDIGQTFSIAIAVNYRNGLKGINLLDSGGVHLFTLQIASDAYTVYEAATGDGNLPNQVYDSNTAFDLSFTQTTGSSGTWSVTRTGGQSDFDSGTYAGVAAGFKLYTQGTGNTASDDFYANSLVVTQVPEASSVGLLVSGAGALLILRRRRSLRP